MTDDIQPSDSLEDKGWKALEFLRKTDNTHAKLETEAKRAEFLYKKTIDAHFKVAEGAVEHRKAVARMEAEPLYIDYLDLQLKADEIRNKRQTAQETINYVRTIMANRRMG
jgi:hypothetical protein